MWAALSVSGRFGATDRTGLREALDLRVVVAEQLGEELDGVLPQCRRWVVSAGGLAEAVRLRDRRYDPVRMWNPEHETTLVRFVGEQRGAGSAKGTARDPHSLAAL